MHIIQVSYLLSGISVLIKGFPAFYSSESQCAHHPLIPTLLPFTACLFGVFYFPILCDKHICSAVLKTPFTSDLWCTKKTRSDAAATWKKDNVWSVMLFSYLSVWDYCCYKNSEGNHTQFWKAERPNSKLMWRQMLLLKSSLGYEVLFRSLLWQTVKTKAFFWSINWYQVWIALRNKCDQLSNR